MKRAERKLRVLVVDASTIFRARIVEVLRTDSGIDVIAEAADGLTAVNLCRDLRPDVVTMDLALPLMTGLAVTEHLMEHFPTPVLVISAATNRCELVNIRNAMAAGAVDILGKPDATEGDKWDRALITAVKMVAKIRVVKRPRAGDGDIAKLTSFADDAVPAKATEPVEAGDAACSSMYALVAVGASTGGPRAVTAVLRGLPDSFSLPILLVMHLGEPFGVGFAKWLSAATGRQVQLAEEATPLSSTVGKVTMAPPGRHLVVQDGVLALTREAERHSCRPSVDILFESVAQEYGARAAACLLTGMGRDGATGMLDVHQSGGLTIAQDEASSVVYGMPGEAVRLGAAQHVLPIDRIGPMLSGLTVRRVGVR